MLLDITDFNGADKLIAKTYGNEWSEVSTVLTKMPLHVKASDEAGIQGSAIFDPVGTNEYIKTALRKVAGWQPGIPIPSEYDFLGKDVDFGKNGVIVEAQFSNYPFLLNNLLRSELFFKGKIALAQVPTALLVIITKAKMFPASQSTLYYEQGRHQLTALAKNKVFEVPIRLVGLFEKCDCTASITYTQYSSARYSRTVVKRVDKKCKVVSGRGEKSRCVLQVVD